MSKNKAGKNAFSIAQQVTVAMQYLHQKCKIIHRDLKSNNIFIEQTDASQSRVQIGDFGLALLSSKTQKSPGSASQGSTSQGSVVWMAPEIIKMKPVKHLCLLFYLSRPHITPTSGLFPSRALLVALYVLFYLSVPHAEVRYSDDVIYVKVDR